MNCSLSLNRLLYLAFVSASAVTAACAGGFELNEHSARATGMGGAYVATLDEPTVLQVNPAGLSFLQGTSLSLGTTVLMPDYRFVGIAPSTASSKMLSQVLFPPNFYLTYTSRSGFGVGISATVPYLTNSEWDPNWVGARLATSSEVRSVFISPSVAFRMSPRLSLGVGLNLVATRLRFSHRVPLDSAWNDGTGTYQGDTQLDYGVQAGVLFCPGEQWSFGASYKSAVDVQLNGGSATFSDIPPSFTSEYPNANVSIGMKTPNEFHFGVGWRPLNVVHVETDLQYVLWSSFKSLSMAFSDPALRDTALQQNWSNTLCFRFGVELVMSDVTLRGGLVVDQSPVPDPYLSPWLPDANRVSYSVGVGYKVGEGLRMDFAYMYSKFADRTITNSMLEATPGIPFNGTYMAFESVVGLNVTYYWN